MSILLSPDVAQNRDLPREYNMDIIEQDPMNTFVFSEKDLPGYRAYSADRAPPRFKDRKRSEKTRKPEYNFRRAIPSECVHITVKVYKTETSHCRADSARGTSSY